MNNVERLKKAMTVVDRIKAEIVKKRNELRDAMSEVDEIIESFDEGLDELAEGRRAFDRALGSMSRFV